jgi:phage-related protein
VGKALNDPIKGITALTRVGVTFNDKQKETIKRLVESGKTLQAQKMILRELRSEFGGSARAAGQTLPGQLAKAKNAFDELAGSLVESLLPALTTLAQVTAKASAFLAKHQTLTKGLVIGVAALSTSLLAFSVAAKAAAAAQVLLNIALIANPIGATIAAVIALGAGLVIAYKKSETFRNIVGGVADFVRKHWQLLLAIIAGPFGIALGLLIKHFDKVRAVAVGAFNLIRGAVVGVINVVRPLVEWLRDRLGNPAVRAAIVNALVSPFNAVRGVIMTVIGAVRTLINLIRSIPSPGDVIGGIAGHLPGLAAGTRNFRGGIALVGERGPELVNLPRGSDVVPLRPGAGAAMRVGAPTVMHFHFGNYVGDRRELIKTITQEVDRIARGNGGRRPF